MEVEQFARARGMLSAMECDTALDWHHLYPHGFVDELDLVFGGRQPTCKTINGLSFRERYCGTLARCFLHTSGMVRCHQQAWVLLLVLVCCVGKPNLLVVAVLSALFGILGLITVFQAIGSVQGALIVLVLVGGICALIHSVSLLYVGFEAAMIWKLSTTTAVPETSEAKKADVIGAAQVVTDAEAGQTKVEA